MLRFWLSRGLLCLAALTALASWSSPVYAQIGLAGVMVDAEGVLKVQFVEDPTGRLTQQRIAAARAALQPDIAEKSELRKISLKALEKAVAESLANGTALPEELRYLAGMTRIQNVFFFPETQDIVIAGPAEGWFADPSGRVRGIHSGKPVLELDDLVVALRSFAPGNNNRPTIGCSIDATQEGLAAMQAYLKQLGGVLSPNADTAAIAAGLKNALGLQRVSVLGVPADTHFAQVLVEADYRMKLIGIGLEAPPTKKLKTYVGAITGASSNSAMQRWYFVPNYECIRASADRHAMELVGSGVKLVSADEVVSSDGKRSASGTVNKASRTYTDSFTKNFAEIADAAPVYAQLRNIVDLSIAAAYIQEQQFYHQAGWSAETLMDDGAYNVHKFSTPKMVDSAVNAFWKGGRFMMPIGGGVHIHAVNALQSNKFLSDEDGRLEARRKSIDVQALANGQWWWD